MINTYRHNNINITTGGSVPVKEWTVGVGVEEEARKQLVETASLPFIFKHIVALPDVHYGKGSTVGSVIPTIGAVIPASVGVDLGCVDSETEFLTLIGWKKISDYTEEDSVLVFSPIGEIAFFETPKYIKLKCDEFWKINTKYGVNQVLSDEHRVLYYKYTRAYDFVEYDTMLASDLAKHHNALKIGFRGRFLTTFNLTRNTSVQMTDSQIRIMIMVCADGCFGSSNKTSTRCYLSFKKTRKINRARNLLNNAGIDFDLSVTNGITKFSIWAPKKFKSLSNFWSASPAQLKIICDEIFHWDGHIKDNVFFTCDKPSADFMSYAFAACGKRSVVRADRRDDGKIDYRVFAHSNTKVGINGTPNKKFFERIKSQDGFKYCFTTSTGYWVMRRHGVIAITGNCGINATKTTIKRSQLPNSLSEIRAVMESYIPHGRTENGGAGDKGAWKDPPVKVKIAWKILEPGYQTIIANYKDIKPYTDPILHLGTLGGNNHFIELTVDENDSVWIMLHSGSRGVGNRIGSYFTHLAKQEMKRWYIDLPNADLAYLPENSEHFNNYLFAVEWAQNFAAENREQMMNQAVEALHHCNGVPKFELTDEHVRCHHNYIAKEFHFGKKIYVTRKGAVSAKKGQLAITPGSMGAKSFIVCGLGNEDSFTSAAHGAGRQMSRTKAKSTFSVEDHVKATEGIECRKDADVIDETPGSYKDIDAVMEAQADLVTPVHTLKQILCIKG